MKKNTVFIVVLLVIVVGGIVALDVLSRNAQQPAAESTVQAENTVAIDESIPDTTTDRYVTFTPEVLTDSVDSRRVLFFYANWCPTCRPVDQSLQQNNDQIPADVTVIRVNYNDNETDQAEKDLAQKYAVTYQHTFVQIDGEGNEVTKWNGGNLDELLKNIK